MNWFLLLLILKCLYAIWAAPIDFEDITTEDLSEATTTNNFLELVENTTASVSETLNLTSKVSQEDYRSATTTEQSTEVNTETEVLNLDIQISQTTENVPKEPKFSSENVTQEPIPTFQTSEQTKTESEEVSSTTTAPETEESTPFLNTETVLSKASTLEESMPQNLQNNLITSIVNVSDIITQEAVTEPFRQLVSANTESNEENLNQDLRNLSEKFTENLTNKQAEENSTDSSNYGTDTIAFETTSSNVEQYNTNYSENPRQSSSGNDFSTNATPEQRTYSSTDNDSTLVINSSVMPNDTQFSGDTPITEIASQKPEQPEVANNLNEGSYFRQSIDSFAEQLKDIGSGVSKTAADLVDKVEETLSPEVAQNSPNYPHISNDNSMEAEQSTEQPEQPSKHSHTFKETVDSFIAEVLDIGSNLNLMNKTEKKEQVLGTDEHSEQYKVNEDTSTESSFVGTEQAETTLNSSSTAENKSEIVQTLDNLVGSASEFSSNFGKTLESLWPINGREQENITEQKTVTDDHLIGEVTQEAASTIQTLVEDTRNGKDVSIEPLNAELGNSKEAISTSISQENSQTKDSNTEIETDSSKQDSISTTQSSVEVESVTNSLDSHQYEAVSAGQGHFPTTVTPLESEVQNISHNQEVENLTSYPELASTNQDSLTTLSDSDLGSLETETHSAQYEVIAPVASVSSATEEEKNANLQLPQQVESSNPEGNEQQNLKASEHTDSSLTDTQTPDSQNKLLENDPFFRTSSSENVGSHFNGIQDSNLNPLSPQDIISTSESITDSSTTAESTTSATHILEATTNAFNKFENTLKTLYVEEKLQQEEKLATNFGNPAKKEEESLTTSSAPASADETTILPKKFEEELQMAVKALEQTTHQQFEEFQNNLKETFKKFTVFGGMEHEKSTESTTTLKSEITTQEPQSVEEITFSTSNEKENATVQETIDKSLDIVMEEPRSGAIHQEFVDAFDENPSTTEVPKESEQNFEISTPFSELPVVKHEALTLASSIESETKGDATTDSSTASTTLTPTVQSEELPTVKHEALTLASSIESETKEVETTESTVVSTTLTPTVQSEEQQVQQSEDVTTAQPEETTSVADVKEDLQAADGEHNTTETENTTTEVTIATTMPSYLETESLQEHVNHDVHNQLGEYNSEVVARETQDLKTEQQLEQEQHTTKEPSEQESVEENHRELIQTDQPPMVVDGDITTTATPETTTEQEMVKFVEHTDETNNDTTEATAKQYKNEELDSTLATLQTQLPLTQASFMEEQQQQIESTTTHAASDVTANDTVVQTTTVVETTEETINSTTVNEEVQEIEATTIPQELLEDTTTIAPMETVEAEARSLSLPPPKLEYLQSVDGVEVFYGYSIVKHN